MKDREEKRKKKTESSSIVASGIAQPLETCVELKRHGSAPKHGYFSAETLIEAKKEGRINECLKDNKTRNLKSQGVK